jgi:hypothetical protein
MRPPPPQKLPIVPIFIADKVSLVVSREKDGKLRAVYAGSDDARVVQPDGRGQARRGIQSRPQVSWDRPARGEPFLLRLRAAMARARFCCPGFLGPGRTLRLRTVKHAGALIFGIFVILARSARTGFRQPLQSRPKAGFGTVGLRTRGGTCCGLRA